MIICVYHFLQLIQVKKNNYNDYVCVIYCN